MCYVVVVIRTCVHHHYTDAKACWRQCNNRSDGSHDRRDLCNGTRDNPGLKYVILRSTPVSGMAEKDCRTCKYLLNYHTFKDARTSHKNTKDELREAQNILQELCRKETQGELTIYEMQHIQRLQRDARHRVTSLENKIQQQEVEFEELSRETIIWRNESITQIAVNVFQEQTSQVFYYGDVTVEEIQNLGMNACTPPVWNGSSYIWDWACNEPWFFI